MEWFRDFRYVERTWFTTEVFNKCTYLVEITEYTRNKTNLFYISISSGKKRKHLDTFRAKELKSSGGVKALVWCKKAMEDFISTHEFDLKVKNKICIAWSDSRRRDIYERFLPEFHLEYIDNQKTLVKNLHR